MYILSKDQFIQGVHLWAGQNIDRIGRMWPLRGGWEGWAQAEIAGFINTISNGNYQIEREARARDGTRQKFDFLINPRESGGQIAVEIKCESLENQGAFFSGFLADIDKLTERSIVDRNIFSRIALGIYFSQRSRDSLANLGSATTLQLGSNLCVTHIATEDLTMANLFFAPPQFQI